MGDAAGRHGVTAMRICKEPTGWLTWAALGLLTIGGAVAEQTSADGPGSRPAGAHGRLQAVPFEKVRVDDPFWSPRIETTQDVTIPNLLAITEVFGKALREMPSTGFLPVSSGLSVFALFLMTFPY